METPDWRLFLMKDLKAVAEATRKGVEMYQGTVFRKKNIWQPLCSILACVLDIRAPEIFEQEKY